MHTSRTIFGSSTVAV